MPWSLVQLMQLVTMVLMSRIFLTSKAAENVKRLQSEMNCLDCGLRFGITGGGCSGHKYIIEFEEKSSSEDLIFEIEGVKIFVNNEHMLKLKNSTIDWVDSLMESGFKIDNPQAKQPCGCGESINF